MPNLSTDQWMISTAGGTVSGSEDYVRARGAMLDALDPPTPYRILPPTVVATVLQGIVTEDAALLDRLAQS